MKENKNNNNIDNIDTSNIFDDFTSDENLKEEIKQMVQTQEKDLYYYLILVKKFFQYFIVFFIIVLFVLFLYVFIQNNENITDNSLLNPLCFIILWDLQESWSPYCSSISSLNNKYISDVESITEDYLWKINSIMENVYKLEHFKDSKEVVFLKNKANSKVDIISILENFDNLINEFEPTEKERLLCYNMEIEDTNVLTVTCDTYSAWYDSQIKWFDWTIDNYVWWTSISYANSFINYIKTQSNIFSINSEPETFNSTSLLLEENWFTNKTSFDLELEYNSNNNFLNF